MHNRNGGVIGALIRVKGMKNGGAMGLADGGVEGHCFANPFLRGWSPERILGESKNTLSFLTPCRCALAVFREEARKALQSIKRASVAVQMPQCSVPSCSAATPTSAVLNHSRYGKGERRCQSSPLHSSRIEQDRAQLR
jgi:hypothetical protein